MPSASNLIGYKFDRLTVLSRSGKSKHGVVEWLCECDCGQVLTVTTGALNTRHVRSCGCRRRKHGASGTPIYNSWCAMMDRCCNVGNPKYKFYGLKGITTCEHWLRFENFLKDMGDRPNGTSIERINNNKGYWCGHCDECRAHDHQLNCKWASPSQQARNRHTSRLITFRGRTQTLVEWENELDISHHTLFYRLSKWDVETAFTKPVRRMRR